MLHHQSCGHRTALAWQSPAPLPSAVREGTTSQPSPKADRKARCRNKMQFGKVLGKKGQWWGQSNEELPLLCSWKHWAVAAAPTWHCHSPQHLLGLLEKLPHHRGVAIPLLCSPRALGNPNITTHHTPQLGALLPPAPERAETSCVSPAQAPPPSLRRKQCVLGLCTVLFSRRQSTTGKSTAQPPQPPERPFPQVRTATTDHLFLQMTLYFKPIPQLNDPT